MSQELNRRKFEIITPDQRIADDPRGLKRVTIVGGLMLREVADDPETVSLTEGQLLTLNEAAAAEGSAA